MKIIKVELHGVTTSAYTDTILVTEDEMIFLEYISKLLNDPTNNDPGSPIMKVIEFHPEEN